MNAFEEVLDSVDPELLPLSGSVLYSGRAAFSKPADLYLLGMNPGGDPVRQQSETIAVDLAKARSRESMRWSAYLDESWRGRAAGTTTIQPRVAHVFRRLSIDLRGVPASNLVFVRSSRENKLQEDFANRCWPLHEAVVQKLDVRLIVCMGSTPGDFLRRKLGAHKLTDKFVEANLRRWTSTLHEAQDGRRVLTIAHPSIADWTAPATDPTPLIQRALKFN